MPVSCSFIVPCYLHLGMLIEVSLWLTIFVVSGTASTSPMGFPLASTLIKKIHYIVVNGYDILARAVRNAQVTAVVYQRQLL